MAHMGECLNWQWLSRIGLAPGIRMCYNSGYCHEWRRAKEA